MDDYFVLRRTDSVMMDDEEELNIAQVDLDPDYVIIERASEDELTMDKRAVKIESHATCSCVDTERKASELKLVNLPQRADIDVSDEVGGTLAALLNIIERDNESTHDISTSLSDLEEITRSEMLHKCQFCSFRHEDKIYLLTHEVLFHGNAILEKLVLVSKPTPFGERYFNGSASCYLCNSYVARKYWLDHLHHHIVKSFMQCQQCTYSTESTDQLRQHTTCHSKKGNSVELRKLSQAISYSMLYSFIDPGSKNENQKIDSRMLSDVSDLSSHNFMKKAEAKGSLGVNKVKVHQLSRRPKIFHPAKGIRPVPTKTGRKVLVNNKKVDMKKPKVISKLPKVNKNRLLRRSLRCQQNLEVNITIPSESNVCGEASTASASKSKVKDALKKIELAKKYVLNDLPCQDVKSKQVGKSVKVASTIMSEQIHVRDTKTRKLQKKTANNSMKLTASLKPMDKIVAKSDKDEVFSQHQNSVRSCRKRNLRNTACQPTYECLFCMFEHNVELMILLHEVIVHVEKILRWMKIEVNECILRKRYILFDEETHCYTCKLCGSKGTKLGGSDRQCHTHIYSHVRRGEDECEYCTFSGTAGSVTSHMKIHQKDNENLKLLKDLKKQVEQQATGEKFGERPLSAELQEKKVRNVKDAKIINEKSKNKKCPQIVIKESIVKITRIPVPCTRETKKPTDNVLSGNEPATEPSITPHSKEKEIPKLMSKSTNNVNEITVPSEEKATAVMENNVTSDIEIIQQIKMEQVTPDQEFTVNPYTNRLQHVAPFNFMPSPFHPLPGGGRVLPPYLSQPPVMMVLANPGDYRQLMSGQMEMMAQGSHMPPSTCSNRGDDASSSGMMKCPMCSFMCNDKKTIVKHVSEHTAE